MTVFAPIPQPAIHIQGLDDVFPVHRIYCVGRNYADHAKEMGSDGREPPFFFCKPADAVVPSNGEALHLAFPAPTDNLHHEAELVVAIGKGGRHLSLEDAQSSVAGYAVGLDMTKRDLQGTAKAAGKPWEIGKAFDQSAPIGPLKLNQKLMREGMLQLWKNGELKQTAHISSMIWEVDEIIVELSKYFELKQGDLIFTGTPAGVGAVQAGDQLRVELEGVGGLELSYFG
jgi:fumarylpyruvate hydrolase